jgi:riboflavin synthase
MFTGIIEAAGKIESFERGPEGGRLRIAFAPTAAGAPDISAEMKLGDSISVNGCCLTVVEFTKQHFVADLSGETLRRTSFGEKKPGGIVNLERPLAAGARLGGHFVQGHVDGVGRVTQLTPEGENWWLSVRVPEELRRYIAEKGSIALDGISLTVARWHDGVADIAVIPFTHEHTSVRTITAGDAINIETDILAKYVESLLGGARQSTGESRVTISRLVEEGF